MSLENGFLVFSIQLSSKFERSAKVLKKSFKSKRQEKAFVDCVTAIVHSLVQEPRDSDSRLEPIPKGVVLPKNCEFRKLVFQVPGRSGAAGEGRLIYWVSYENNLITLLWIYTHDEFKGRPADQDLRIVIRDALEEEE
jgi:mRNA-degrading endonuclease YafQ of YafQ-DinJ toxin-antitoxin module